MASFVKFYHLVIERPHLVTAKELAQILGLCRQISLVSARITSGATVVRISQDAQPTLATMGTALISRMEKELANVNPTGLGQIAIATLVSRRTSVRMSQHVKLSQMG